MIYMLNKDQIYFLGVQNLLKNMIKGTSFAIAQDETRPILQGILFEVKNKNLNSLIYFFISSRIFTNKLYSNSIIFSSAFKISASFSFKIGLIYLSQLANVCFLS